MAVLAVVPGKECLAMAPGVFDAAKALREVAAVFHGLELRLRIGVVIRGVGSAVAQGQPTNWPPAWIAWKSRDLRAA